MKVTKFRGMREDGGGWAIGKLCYNNVIKVTKRMYFDGEYSHDECKDVHVDPETVGQFTGQKDKSKVEICEGDVVRNKFSNSRFLIEWHFAGFKAKSLQTGAYSVIDTSEKVIGNITENPELLEVKK